MTGDVRILSVAPRYRPGTDGAQDGHYTIYQDDLRAAARRLGVPMTVLADRSVTPSEDTAAVLETTDAQSISASASKVARPGDVLMVYEGSRAMVEAFASAAADHPDIAFVVNLFRPEPGLVPGKICSRPSSSEPAAWLDLPPNLIVSAETELRVELARGLGIPCVGAWRIHTTLWDVDVRSAGGTSSRDAEDGLRVLVPLSNRGYAEEPVRDIAYVLHRLRRRQGEASIRLTLTGAGAGSFAARTRGPRLQTLGALRVTAPSSRDGYAALFAEHDVVWIPHREFYRSQSSGKTLDALAVGRPVVATAGTWPAQESSRWVGEELSYADPEGLVRLLFDLNQRVHEFHCRLSGGAAAIRAAYAPEATLLRVLELVAERSESSAAERWPPPRALPPIASRLPSCERPVERATGMRLEVMRARLAARRTSLIGPRQRLERSARRRFSGVRTALRNARHSVGLG